MKGDAMVGSAARELADRGQVVAVIPMKSLDRAKSRLGPVLPATVRIGFILCMLRDVLTACLASGVFERVGVITADNTVGQLAEQTGGIWIREPGGPLGLNAAIDHASEWAAHKRAGALLILSGDLPLAHPSELQRLIAVGDSSDLIIVPEHGGTGTNAIFLRPPGIIPTYFGCNSRHLHRRAAEQAGLRWDELQLTGLGYDIDTPRDILRVARLLFSPGSPWENGQFQAGFHTRRFLQQLYGLDWSNLEAAVGGGSFEP